MKNHRTGSRRGFTLIELLVVIAIIGILAGMLLPVLSAAQERANIAAATAMIKNLAQALKEYNSDYGLFPPDGGSPWPSDPLVIYLDGNTANGGPRKLYMDFKVDNLNPAGTKVLDPWGREYHYRELYSLNLGAPTRPTTGGNPDFNNAAMQWNQHTYDLWSQGPDVADLSTYVSNF
jgi:prepilin-type N-terminal cleavage/methylation domain-containing protein